MLIKCSLATHRFFILPWRLIHSTVVGQNPGVVCEWGHRKWSTESVSPSVCLLHPFTPAEAHPDMCRSTQTCAGLLTTNTTEFYTFTPRPVEYSTTTSTGPTSLQCSEKNSLTCTKAWLLLNYMLSSIDILCKSRRYLSIVGIWHVQATATGSGEGRGCYWVWQV